MKRSVPFQVYLIGNRHQSKVYSLKELVYAAGEAGISAFQFREKDLSLGEQYALASELRDIAKQFGMKFIVNGRIDLCLALDADGVQLSVRGFPIAAARKLLGPNRLIGLSCHSKADVLSAQNEGANFAVLGPVYATPSKQKYGAALGINTFKKIRECTNIPLFAIGGIKQDRLHAVFEAGADGIALISAISTAKDVGTACRDFLKEIDLYSFKEFS